MATKLINTCICGCNFLHSNICISFYSINIINNDDDDEDDDDRSMYLIEHSKFERVYKTIKIILIHHYDLMYVI